MVAHADQPTNERQLLDRAITILITALAADEAQRSGAGQAECAQLRRAWVPDADSIIEQAEEMGLLADEEGE